jgi:hypothetical protein
MAMKLRLATMVAAGLSFTSTTGESGYKGISKPEFNGRTRRCCTTTINFGNESNALEYRDKAGGGNGKFCLCMVRGTTPAAGRSTRKSVRSSLTQPRQDSRAFKGELGYACFRRFSR